LSSTVPRNNCYAYAIQHLSQNGTPYKLQPGDLSGLKNTDFSLATCHPAHARILRDLVTRKRGYQVPPDAPCKQGYGKIALMLSPSTDYHLLRLNKDVVYPLERGETVQRVATKFRVPVRNVVPMTKGRVRVKDAWVYSHKRGLAYPPTLYDAKGKMIFDPRTANLDYGDLNYSRYCSSFCVKQKPCARSTTFHAKRKKSTTPPSRAKKGL
jgi:hypothetical protein